MGYTYWGVNEGILQLNTALRKTALMIQILCLLLTLFTIYVISFTSYIRSRKYVMIMRILLLLSLTHQIIQFLYFYSNTPPLFDWFFSWCAMLLIMSNAIAHTEIFGCFSSISGYWNSKKIVYIQIFWFVLMQFCFLRVYVHLGIIGQPMPLEIEEEWAGLFLYTQGLSIYAGLVSIYQTIQCFIVVRIIYIYLHTNTQEIIAIRRKRMIRFVVIVILAMVIDLTGIALFTYAGFSNEYAPFAIMGISCLHLHTCNVAVIFHHLRHIALIKEEEVVEKVIEKDVLKGLSGVDLLKPGRKEKAEQFHDLPTVKMQPI